MARTQARPQKKITSPLPKQLGRPINEAVAQVCKATITRLTDESRNFYRVCGVVSKEVSNLKGSDPDKASPRSIFTSLDRLMKGESIDLHLTTVFGILKAGGFEIQLNNTETGEQYRV